MMERDAIRIKKDLVNCETEMKRLNQLANDLRVLLQEKCHHPPKSRMTVTHQTDSGFGHPNVVWDHVKVTCLFCDKELSSTSMINYEDSDEEVKRWKDDL